MLKEIVDSAKDYFCPRAYLDNPGFSDVRFLGRFYKACPRWKLTKEQTEKASALMAAKMNKGVLDERVIPFLDKVVSLHSHHARSSFEEDTGKLESPFGFYYWLLNSAVTEESVPYLMQALDSNYVLPEDMPFKKEKVGEPRRISGKDYEYGQKGLDYGWYYEVDKEWIEQDERLLYRAKVPFGELAKAMLSVISMEVIGKTKIYEAIDLFDLHKTRVVEKRYTTRDCVSKKPTGRWSNSPGGPFSMSG